MKIKWIGDARIIPPYGEMTYGQVKDLPDDVAQSYVNQKLAEKVKADDADTQKRPATKRQQQAAEG